MKKLIVLLFVFIITGMLQSTFSGDKKNLTESIDIYNTGNELSIDNIEFYLHLKNDFEKLSYSDAVKLGDDNSKYSSSILKLIEEGISKVDATLPKAETDTGKVKVIFMTEAENWSEDNVVIYVECEKGYLILPSFNEIKRAVLMSAAYNIQPDVKKTLLGKLKNGGVYNGDLAEFYKDYTEKEETYYALSIMEKEIRKLNVEEKGALLKNEESPKLNNALKDSKVLEAIENTTDSTVQWAFKYLSDKEIIKESEYK